MEKVVIFKVFRWHPEKDKKPYYKEYELSLTPGMTVLDALLHIRDHIDPTLAFRKSCRMGVCGSCAMFINGKPRLACYTQIEHLGTDRVTVEPLPNYPVVKDLVVDMGDFFAKHQSVKPYVIRDDVDPYKPETEFLQTPEEFDRFFQFTYCIKCGACLAACPTVASSPGFLGPQALAQAYRYIVDTRDGGYKIRLDAIDTADGPFRCHFAGACTEACPKGVDPALAIQHLKRHIFFGRKHEPAKPVPLNTEYKPNEKIRKPPEFTV